MPSFDLTDAVDPVLDYKVRSRAYPDGRTYRVESPDGRTGMHLTLIHEVAAAAASGEQISAEDAAVLRLNDAEQKSFFERVLGSAFEEMCADGVKWPHIRDVAVHAYLYINRDNEAAVSVMNGMLGKAEPAEAPDTTSEASPAPPETRNGPARKAGSRSNRASTPTPARTRKTGTGTRGTGASSSTPAPTPGPVRAAG